MGDRLWACVHSSAPGDPSIGQLGTRGLPGAIDDFYFVSVLSLPSWSSRTLAQITK